MAYDFFLSYPRAVESPVLTAFIEDLHDLVRYLRGFGKDARVGFLDATDLTRGADWPADLRDALQTAKTIIPIYCPAYFMGGFCEKELRIFNQRQEAYRDATQVMPHIVKPIPWIVPFTVPADLAHLQYQVGGSDAIEAQGMFQVLKNKARYRARYNDFMRDLALDIKNTADAHVVPPLNDFPALTDDEPSDAGEEGVESGPDHVRFVYIAPRQEEAQGMQRALNFYSRLRCGWKPFDPDVTRGIGPFAQAIAGEYDFSSDELVFSPNLADDIRNAETRGNLVVILVDGWSARIDGYRGTLAVLDERRYFNTGIVVPWNLGDGETMTNFDALSKTIRRVLRRWSSEGNPVHYNDQIRSPEDFKKHLADALTRLKADVLINIPTDHAPGKKPVIDATQGAGA
ncbi:MAG TPA: FxsC protein [Thermoanaerobaculia bacterium]|nr:FxsC protein [Thermoanaerobaculia bacterium]